MIGQYRRAWLEGTVWESGGDEVYKVGRPSGSGQWSSDLGVGNIILGLGNIITEEQDWGLGDRLGL